MAIVPAPQFGVGASLSLYSLGLPATWIQARRIQAAESRRSPTVRIAVSTLPRARFAVHLMSSLRFHSSWHGQSCQKRAPASVLMCGDWLWLMLLGRNKRSNGAAASRALAPQASRLAAKRIMHCPGGESAEAPELHCYLGAFPALYFILYTDTSGLSLLSVIAIPRSNSSAPFVRGITQAYR